MAEKNYTEWTKEELVDEIKSRRAEGRKVSVDLRSPKEDLAKALEQDDQEGEETSPEKLSKEAAARADGVSIRKVPSDLAEYKGNYRYRRTGETGFGLKVLPESQVRSNKTHLAKSPLKFWDGTEEEFRDQFDKV